MANSSGSAAKSSSRRCLTRVNVTTPTAAKAPLPTKLAVAEKHTRCFSLDGSWLDRFPGCEDYIFCLGRQKVSSVAWRGNVIRLFLPGVRAMSWRHLIEAPWIVFVVYWAIGALKTRRTATKESFASRYGILFLEIVGFVLLFSEDAEFGVLGRRVIPRGDLVASIGVALTWAGIGIALWARWHLGQYWSARITIKEDHKLIRTGPYARLRHPIYTGLDLAVIGSALAIDQWRCVGGG